MVAKPRVTLSFCSLLRNVSQLSSIVWKQGEVLLLDQRTVSDTLRSVMLIYMAAKKYQHYQSINSIATQPNVEALLVSPGSKVW